MTIERTSPGTEASLLPCPFCGGRANVYENEVDFVTKWSVGCGDCNCNMDVCEDTPADAVVEWNTRSPISRPAQCSPEHVREQCIKICLEEAAEWDSDNLQTFKNYAGHCANRISDEVVTTVSSTLRCIECDQNYADPPSKLCHGCEAYQEHQR